VIFFQARRHLLQRNQPGSGKNAGLTHASTQSFAVPAGFFNERLAANQH
jgi:hypothetical protein